MLTITKICWGKKFKNEIANYFLPYKSVLLRREHNNYNSNQGLLDLDGRNSQKYLHQDQAYF
jgi:hypothetical protein